MSDGDIDYSNYTLRELEEALAGINAKLYPKNYLSLRSRYEALTQSLPPDPKPLEPFLDTSEVPASVPQYDAHGRYIPNRIPGSERLANAIFSLLLFGYGSYGVLVNDLYIPGKRSRGIHLHDVPAWIMYGAMICASFVMLSVIVDHYDRRNNERHYRAFAETGKFIGWGLFGASLFWALFRE